MWPDEAMGQRFEFEFEQDGGLPYPLPGFLLLVAVSNVLPDALVVDILSQNIQFCRERCNATELFV